MFSYAVIEAFEKNRLQEQRIAIERQKANALRAQANALENQNRLRWVEIYNQERIMNQLNN